MYNQFYFLHLDKITAKTAGIRMFNSLYNVIENNGISAIELNKTHMDHNHWKDFDPNTFILCLVRDPVWRTLSDFVWWSNYGDVGIRTHNKNRDRDCPTLTIENLLAWLNTKHVKNYQSRIIGNNILRINMLLRVEGLKGNENKFRNNLLNSLGISYKFSYYPPDYEQTFMPIEDPFLNLINNNLEILEIIKKYNQEDIELYSHASII
jgi:hypothetical protein